ncbi:Cof-type HAD-IIB family hydrolase [Oceanobacillus sp. CFH 90083]|uniref:Cof-type HAD-IIB family hydrolase n=1 Tax=Oceanobacillus sp. CFH 90083 TaxID=2592336 RepID=UPI00128C809F|nr:Cof-type HAD-IIB family hydrolase [Oceanobacillus sp. CFH 90083]
MIKLVAVDMDGTLLDTNKQISSANKDAIQACIDQGIKIVLSTGRPFSHVKPYVNELNLNNFFVTANGGQILNAKEEVISQHYLSADHLSKLVDLCEANKLSYWALTAREFFTNQFPANYMDKSWLKFGIRLETAEEAEILRKYLKETNLYEVSNTLPTNIELNPVGINKATGIEFVCKQMGIDMNEVMAIGDALNDAKLIKKAKLGIAMGNAQQYVKEIADFITKDNNNDGVACALNKFILRVREG